MTNADVLDLLGKGVSNRLIVTMIGNASSKFDTSTASILSLRQKGVSDDVLEAMINAEGPPDESDDGVLTVYVSDSQSWQMTSGFAFGQSGGGGYSTGGARPQTAEIIKTFRERCPEIPVTNERKKADYVILLDHEGGKGWVRKDNKVAVFNRDGLSIYSGSTRSLGNSVKDACRAIREFESDSAESVLAVAPEEQSAAPLEVAKEPEAITAPRIQTNSDDEPSGVAEQREPARLHLGMSREEVEDVLGLPETLVELGDKTIYKFPDMYIEFVAGTLSDLSFGIQETSGLEQDSKGSSQADTQPADLENSENSEERNVSPARLFIFRQKNRGYRDEREVYLDGQLMANLRSGYFLSATVEPGRHEVSSHGAMRKAVFTFEPGLDYCIEVVTNALGLPSTKVVDELDCQEHLRDLRLQNEENLASVQGR